MTGFWRESRSWRAILALAVMVLWAGAARAVDFERFFGRFEGEAIADGGTELSKRDLRVNIGPSEKGFVVEWVALIPKADGRTKRVAYEIPFRATRREGIFGSAMKSDMFGHAVPLDPLKGEPYVWARIVGNVLSVYSMLITESGGYEMQVYDRKVVNGAMELTYSRVRDGEVLRTVRGTLARVE